MRPRFICFPVDSLPADKGIKQVVSMARTKTPRPGSIQSLVPALKCWLEHTLEGRLEDVSQRLRGQGGNRRQTIRGALQF